MSEKKGEEGEEGSEGVAPLGATSSDSGGGTLESSQEEEAVVQMGPHLYERVALLGRGDVGKVYLVKERSSGELFSMKVLTKREMVLRNKACFFLAFYRFSWFS